MSYLISGLLCLTLMSSGIGYWQYRVNIHLHQQVTESEVKLEIQSQTINTISNNLIETTKRVEFVQHQNDLITSNAAAQIKVLESHNLEDLAERKTGLIELQVNRATMKAFDKLEDLTDPNWKP